MVQREAIYKGATRPAMKFGVPLVPLGMLFVLWGGLLLSWWIAAGVVGAILPALTWMRFVTTKDDQRFLQVFLSLKLRLHDRNRALWNARRYSPSIYRGGRP